MVVVAIAVPAVVIAIPAMVVLHAAAIALPVSGEVAPSLIAGNDPSRATVRRPRPISSVPRVMISDRVPISVDPIKFRAGAHRADAEHTRRRWRANGDSDGYLRNARSYGQ